MGVYVVRRLVIGVIVVGLVSIVAYLGLEAAPGDELTARLGPDALATMSSQQIAERKHELGLDRPLPVRYVKWLGGALHGDLGYSSGDDIPVSEDLRQHLGPTLLLLGVAMLVGSIVALTLGIIAALRQHTATDYVLGALPILLIGIPGFVLALAVIYLFSVYLHLLPTSGMHTLGDDSVGDLFRHLVLPASVLAIGFAAPLLRYTRASMIEALSADYMVAARAKGLPARTVILRHGLRNALLPIITVIGLSLPDMVAGAVITEQVFGWPGMGQLAVRAAGNRDVSAMMGVVLLVAIVVTFANLVTDLAYARADPRVRLG